MPTPMAQRIVAIHESLAAAGVSHALGGAVALAYHTLRPRATNDIDLNVFVDGSRAAEVLRALPPQVRWSSRHVRIAGVTGEVKLRWQREGPVDLFFSKDDYHRLVDQRKEQKPFAGATIPVLSATDLTVFKAVLGGRGTGWTSGRCSSLARSTSKRPGGGSSTGEEGPRCGTWKQRSASKVGVLRVRSGSPDRDRQSGGGSALRGTGGRPAHVDARPRPVPAPLSSLAGGPGAQSSICVVWILALLHRSLGGGRRALVVWAGWPEQVGEHVGGAVAAVR